MQPDGTQHRICIERGEPAVRSLCRHPGYRATPRSRSRYGKPGSAPHGKDTQTLLLTDDQANATGIRPSTKIVLGLIQYLESRPGRPWTIKGLAALLNRKPFSVRRDVQDLGRTRHIVPPDRPYCAPPIGHIVPLTLRVLSTNTSPRSTYSRAADPDANRTGPTRSPRGGATHPTQDSNGQRRVSLSATKPSPAETPSGQPPVSAGHLSPIAAWLASLGLRPKLPPAKRATALERLAERCTAEGLSLFELRKALAWARAWRWGRSPLAIFAHWLEHPRRIRETIQWLVTRKQRCTEHQAKPLENRPPSRLSDLLAGCLTALDPSTATGSAPTTSSSSTPPANAGLRMTGS